MRIPNPYFENVPVYGNLVMDEILVDYVYPLLSVLKDKSGHRYLCMCFDTRGAQQWIVAPISSSKLIKLKKNKLTLYDAFRLCEKIVILAVRNYETRTDSFQQLSPDDIPEEDLPPIGEYLDAEDDEWDAYIETINADSDPWDKSLESDTFYSSSLTYKIAGYILLGISQNYQDVHNQKFSKASFETETTEKILCPIY